MSTLKKKVVAIKVGSNVITNKQGLPDEQVIVNISNQIKSLKDEGYQVLLISSGAVAAGKSLYQFAKKTPVFVAKGTVQTEDVMFNFKSADKKTTFRVFLDELDQSSLDSKRAKAGAFDCN